MSRRRRQAKRQIVDDPIYGLKSVSKFINALMIGGKKTTAEKIFYNSFSLIIDCSGRISLTTREFSLDLDNELNIDDELFLL